MNRKLTPTECIELLIELTQYYPRTVWLIDAVDECRNPYGILNYLDFIQERSSNLKIFMSSRLSLPNNGKIADIRIIQHFESSSDIEAFVRYEINSPLRRARSGMTSEQATQLHELLVSRAEGM